MDLLDKYAPEHGHDVWQYLSVVRQEIIDALRAQPHLAVLYFDRVRPRGVKMHDVTWLDGEDGRYRIYWSDHGKECDVVHYDDLFQAVADHVLETHGMK